MKITRIGIDLGKSAFHVCATDRSGKVVLAKVFTRRALRPFMAGLEPCLVGLEACGVAHVDGCAKPRVFGEQPS